MRFIKRLVLIISVATIVLLASAFSADAQKARAKTALPDVVQQPLISEYKGIRLGMTSDQVRTKLGTPTLKAEDQDYFVFSETETAQFAYDAAHKVVTVSVDYTGANAPDYRNVVGPTVEERPDGSQYKIVRYEAQGFWVSYHRTAGGAVTVTLQKI